MARARGPAWLRAFNQGEAALDGLLAADMVLHADDPFLPSLPPGGAGLGRWLSTLRTAFPDLKLTIEHESGQGRTHVYTFAARGTHRGPLANVRPTGKPVAFIGQLMVRHDEREQIAELWLRTNLASLVPQLGMAPAPPVAQERAKRAARGR